MALERWLIDGYEITEGTARDVELLDGLRGTSGMSGSNITIPGRDGALWTPKMLNPGQFTLSIWLGESTRAAADKAWERIVRAAVKRYRLVLFTHYRTDGTVRIAYGEVVGAIKPTPLGQMGYRAQLEVSVPSGVWQDQGTVDTGNKQLAPSGTDALPVSFNQSVQLTPFVGASAPLTDLVVTLTGPMRMPIVTCPETKAQFSYNGTIPAGTSMTVDAGQDIVTGAPNQDSFSYTGPYMIEAIPPDDGVSAPVLTVRATQGTSATTIRVVGTRRYLIE